MANKRSGKAKQAEFKGFINIYLKKEDDNALNEIMVQGIDVLTHIQGWLELGYKVSYSNPDRDGSICCTVYAASVSEADNGLGFTSWASDAYEATIVAIYKYTTYVLPARGLYAMAGERDDATGKPKYR